MGVVFNLFAHLIPQDSLTRMERGRKRQGLMPDFLMELDVERDQKKAELALFLHLHDLLDLQPSNKETMKYAYK